jgi:hypothetical protein
LCSGFLKKKIHLNHTKHTHSNNRGKTKSIHTQFPQECQCHFLSSMKLQETSFDLDMSHDDGGIVKETSREQRGSSTQEKNTGETRKVEEKLDRLIEE